MLFVFMQIHIGFLVNFLIPYLMTKGGIQIADKIMKINPNKRLHSIANPSGDPVKEQAAQSEARRSV